MKTIEKVYREFCRERFPLPTEQQVSDLERRIHVSFPGDYRRFLLEFNGGYFSEPYIQPPEDADEGCPHLALNLLNGIGASHPTAELARPFDLRLFDDNDPPKIVPIGDTPENALIILYTQPEGRGQIFLKEPSGGWYFLAYGIEEFFQLLHDWPEEWKKYRQPQG
jgi:hypothetical protein